MLVMFVIAITFALFFFACRHQNPAMTYNERWLVWECFNILLTLNAAAICYLAGIP